MGRFLGWKFQKSCPSGYCSRGILLLCLSAPHSSLPPAVAAAGVAADEEERHPLLTPRSGLQNKMNQSHGEVSLV